MTVFVPFVDLSIQHQAIQSEIETTLLEVVRQGHFVLGEALTQFETDFALASGGTQGIGVGSGTDAIALGLQACGVGAGDEVLVPANTFIATLIGVLRAGAKPVLVDCCLDTALIDLTAAAQAVTSQTKAIVPVHLYGQMVSPTALQDFATAHNLLIFEDSAQAHLAQREGYTAGSVGIAAAYSFYPSKNLGSFGDGGMVVTQDEAIAQKIRCYRNYGAAQKYLHTEPGLNSRLDNLQAAILGVKLPHLKTWNQQRNEAAQIYAQALVPLQIRGIIPLTNESGSGHVYHLYVVRVDERSPLNRDQLRSKLSDRGIQTGIHYPIPCHLQPAYKFLNYEAGDFPNAEQLCQEILSLPMYPGLSSKKIQTVAATIEETI
ncbi:MAG: DegT/DnrJ/EryC1/StrS family aminotransferase [Spirulina sp. SIO3F2]|nr:DegT/DnrJ/EryC1/StrS family aminotransferase [Spirulina sp. SIO3F2]